MCEHFPHPRPYHGDMTFFTHEGTPTADDYLTDSEDCVGPAIGMHEADRDIISETLGVMLLESCERKSEEKDAKMGGMLKTVRRNFDDSKQTKKSSPKVYFA